MTDRLAALHLILTTACNLRCAYCYQSRSRPGRMAWETLRAALDWALRVAHPNLEIILSGGEPLLELPLVRRAVAYVEERSDPVRRPRFVLQSNGMLLTDAVIDFLEEHGIELQLSFDGVAEVQDLRALGSFEFLDGLLCRLRSRWPEFYRKRFNVAATVTPETVSLLARSFEYFLDREVPEIAITAAWGGNSDWNPARTTELEGQFDRVLQFGVARFRKDGEIPLTLLRGASPPSPSDGCRAMCGVVRGLTPAVDVDGEVSGCAVLCETALTASAPWFAEEARRLRIGNLGDPDFEARFEAFAERAACSRVFTEKERKHSALGRCADCAALDDCSICPASIGSLPGNADPDRVPDFGCAFERTVARTRERFRQAVHPEPVSRLTGRSELPEAMRKVRAFMDR